MNHDESMPLLDDQPGASTPFNLRQLLIFLIPSLLGVLLFLTPIVYEEKVTIGLGVMADALKAAFNDHLPAIATALLLASAALGLLGSLFKPRWLTQRPALNELFNLPPLWLGLRVLGALFAAMTFWQFGPEWVWGANTGGVVLKDLAPVLITFFLVAGLILPLLTDYGLMEFCGTLVRNVFRKIFGLPGRSAIDAIANCGDDRFAEGNRAAWRALEDAYRAGKLGAIGVSNFQRVDVENLLEGCRTAPMVNQVLAHISNLPTVLIEFSQAQGMLVEAYSPIAHGELMKNDQVTAMAERYGVSVPQLAIRFTLELGLLPLPKTTKPAHMKNNAAVDFEIRPEDLDVLKNLPPIEGYGEHSEIPVFAVNG